MMNQQPSLARALQIAVFNTVIAGGISTFMGGGFWVNLVYLSLKLSAREIFLKFQSLRAAALSVVFSH